MVPQHTKMAFKATGIEYELIASSFDDKVTKEEIFKIFNKVSKFDVKDMFKLTNLMHSYLNIDVAKEVRNVSENFGTSKAFTIEELLDLISELNITEKKVPNTMSRDLIFDSIEPSTWLKFKWIKSTIFFFPTDEYINLLAKDKITAIILFYKIFMDLAYRNMDIDDIFKLHYFKSFISLINKI